MEMSLTKLPWYGQVGAFFGLALAGVGAFVYYYEMPARAEFESRQQQLDGLRKDIAMGMDTAKKLPEFRAQVGELEARLNNLKAVLPEEKDAADLLRRMQTVATQSNLTIKSFRPAPTVTKQLHAEWPINLELDGNYPQPRDVLRSRQQVHAHREHQHARSEGPRDKPRPERDDPGQLRRHHVRVARKTNRFRRARREACRPGHEGDIEMRVLRSMSLIVLLASATAAMLHAQQTKPTTTPAAKAAAATAALPKAPAPARSASARPPASEPPKTDAKN